MPNRIYSLPDALVIGPMKAGTTWVHEYLAARGDVALPRGVKEVFYFDRYHARGREWYARHFRDASSDKHVRCVEVAPSLFHDPEAPRRVARDLGSVRLVVTTRDPVARSWSHYQHLRRYGVTRKPLQAAVADHPEIVAASRYEDGLARWQSALPDARLSVIDMGLLRTEPQAYADALCDALELPRRRDPSILPGTSYAAAQPRSVTAARMASSLSLALRSMGLYRVLNAAKQLGLREVIFGDPRSEGARLTPTQAELDWLRARLDEGAGVDISA